MAEYDTAWDAECELEDYVLSKLKELKKFKGNQYNYSGLLQCLEFFNNKIYNCKTYIEFEDLTEFLEELEEELSKLKLSTYSSKQFKRLTKYLEE